MSNQKVDGITERDFEYFGLTAINSSFFHGNLESIRPDLFHGHAHDDSDDDNEHSLIHTIQQFLTSPVSSWLIISKEENKIYKVWAGIEIFCCLISSYYYAYISIFYYSSIEGNQP